MARPRQFDETEVLESAVALFQEQGFEGARIPELTRKLGICRQSLYNTFGDKRGLYVKALERWGEREIDARLALLEGEGSPLENVRTVIRGFAAMAAGCPNEGCLTVTAMVENRDLPEVVDLVERQVERLEEGFRETLQRALDNGELNRDARPDRLARVLITTGYGIGLLTRLPGSGPRIGDSVSYMLDLIDDASA